MRSCAVWLTVMGLLVATASSVEAAPKKKRHKAAAAAAADSGDTEAAPVEPAKPKSVDDMMDDSSKPSAAPKRAQASEPDEPAPSASESTGEPDAWERPPAEEEKPKKNRHAEAAAVHYGDGRNINIGLLAGYGVSLGSGFSSLNPYGFGVGLQGDYELESHWVFGIGGEFFIGSSATTANAIGSAAGVAESTYARYILAHALVGYDIWFSNNFYLRPSIWVGAAIGLVPVTMKFLNGTVFDLMIAPGLTLHYLMGTNGWYIGADIRIAAPLGHDGMTGLPLLATLGKRF